jgi:hypothetical protein
MVLTLAIVTPEVARADVALPTIAIAFGSPAWLLAGLAAVIAVESLVLWGTLALVGLTLWQAVAVASVANGLSTLIGIPVAWFALVVLFELVGDTTGNDIRTRSGRLRDAVWVAPWIVPHEYVDWDAYQGEWDWIIPAKVLVLLLPFFFASWLVEHAVASRMLGLFGVPLGAGVLVGNVVTYGLMALIALRFLVSDLRRAAPIVARTRAVEQQRQELRQLGTRARTAFKARDLAALRAVQERLSRLRAGLLDAQLTWLADDTCDLCRECLARLQSGPGSEGKSLGRQPDVCLREDRGVAA